MDPSTRPGRGGLLSLTTTNPDKRALREELRAALARLPPAAIARASARISARLVAACPLGPGAVVAVFAARAAEVELADFVRSLEDQGATAAYPRIDHDELSFVAVGRAQLVPGRFGILAPPPGLPAVERLDLIIAPGLGFGRRGERLGHGRGYYDRAIARARRQTVPPPVVGVCFAQQIVGAVPEGPLDQRLDALATEEEWLSFGPRSV